MEGGARRGRRARQEDDPDLLLPEDRPDALPLPPRVRERHQAEDGERPHQRDRRQARRRASEGGGAPSSESPPKAPYADRHGHGARGGGDVGKGVAGGLGRLRRIRGQDAPVRARKGKGGRDGIGRVYGPKKGTG